MLQGVAPCPPVPFLPFEASDSFPVLLGSRGLAVLENDGFLLEAVELFLFCGKGEALPWPKLVKSLREMSGT